MNIKALRQKKTELLAKANTIFAATETRELTDIERADYDATMAKVKTVNEDIKRAEALMDEERIAPTATAGVSVGENLAEKKPWTNLAEQLNAVKQHASTNGRVTDPRIQAALGSSESVDSEGGILVQPEFSAGILKRTYDAGLITGRCYPLPMSSSRLVMKAVDEDSRADGSRWGGIQAFWQSEAQNYTGTKPKFREMNLVANKLTGLVYVTEEELADAPALEAYINDAVPQEFSFKLDDAVFNGGGNGIPLGVLTSGAFVQVLKDAGQAAKTISTTNITGMWKRMYARSRQNAVWFINQDCEDQLLSLTLGAGTAVTLLYTPPGVNGNNSGYGLLMGRPVIPVEQCATVGTQGDIVLADMSQYLLATRSGIRADSSIHVAFITGEMAFRFMLRADGQPMWKKPLTPKNGTNTLSPFVVLQSR